MRFFRPKVNSQEELDLSVNESAAWELGYIENQNASLSNQKLEARAVKSIIFCLQ